MGNPKGGLKLRRSAKHKPKYAAQFNRTSRNKARRAQRVARRKARWVEKAQLEAIASELKLTEKGQQNENSQTQVNQTHSQEG